MLFIVFNCLKMCKQDSAKEQSNNSLEIGLYDDLAKALPSGVYRLRVFHDVSLIEDKWYGSKEVPYVVEFANDRFFEILHLERSVFKVNPGIISDLIFEADKSDFAKANVEANLKIIPFVWEGRFLINDTIIWIHFKSIPRVLDNQDIIWTGTLDDITLRKQTEEEIKLKNAELQRLNADKDILMSILAHDLICPFNSILGYLELLTANLRHYDLDKIEEQITVVNHSATSAFHLLEDILLWARSQSGAIPFEPREFNLKLSFARVFDVLKPSADSKNISINIGDAEKINVFADVDMLNTILRNLVSNAVKFTNSGGQIHVSAEKNLSNVTISVSDNGVGIAPDVIPKLFDMTKLYSTRGTSNEKGTGFGILLCKKFVEMHGGKIWVESELGKGCEVKFTLPVSPALSCLG